MNMLVWGLEWRRALARRRDLALWMLAPLALVIVLGTDAVTALGTASWYATIFTSVAVLRTIFPVMWDGERGMTARVVRGGISPGGYLIQRAAASASISLAQLIPSAVAAGILLHASVSELLVVVAALAISLWIAALVGVLAASVSRTRMEAVAISAVVLLLLLHMSGVFRVPPSGGFGASLEEASPFRALHEAFVRMVSGGGARGGVAELAWAIGLPALIAAVAPGLVDSLARKVES